MPLVAITVAQRPPYAGKRPIGVPELASRFRPEGESSTSITATQADNSLSNRLGEDSANGEKLPVDALGDADLVNRLKQWPRDQQPFWLLNAAAIEEHRRQQPSVNLASRFSGSETIPAKPSVSRSPFAGSSRF